MQTRAGKAARRGRQRSSPAAWDLTANDTGKRANNPTSIKRKLVGKVRASRCNETPQTVVHPQHKIQVGGEGTGSQDRLKQHSEWSDSV